MSARHSFAYRFRTEHFDGLRRLFAPRKPRHPILRVAFALAGVALLLGLIVVGAVVGTAMLLGGMLLRLVKPRAQPAARRADPERVVEGEFRVIEKSALPSGR